MEKYSFLMVKIGYKWSLTWFLFLILCLPFQINAKGLPAPFPATNFVHPLHVSVTEIKHNTTNQSLEISCKIFLEDLENAIEKILKKKVDLTHPADKAAAKKLINEYLQKHLQLKADGKLLNLQFIGYEREKEIAWCYFEVTNIKQIKKLNITNSILYDVLTGQINMMHVTVDGKRKSFKVTQPQTQAGFEF